MAERLPKRRLRLMATRFRIGHTSFSTVVKNSIYGGYTSVASVSANTFYATQVSPAPSSTASARLHQDASAPPTSADPSTAAAAPSAAHQHRLQLLVRPIVKSTVGQRDTSGEALDNFAVNGATFDDINHKLWRQFGSRVKGQAVKQDGVWTISTPTETSWSKVMQFKGSRHLVDSEKTEQAWSRWVVSTKGEAVRLMIYEYGMAITKAPDLEGFREACIRPAFTDRSGASAESSVRDVVAQLQDIWSETFQARAVVWRMWANHVMRGLDRSTWDRDILEPPRSQIANLLKPADLPAERQLAGLSRSSDLALQVVNAAIEDNKRLKATWKAHGERLENLEQLLLTRKRTIEAILAGTRLPSLSDVIDPLPALTNIEDIEHQE
ncbi:hypothetical protein PF003_g35702 [Phytophthora fragariae]|nr:hypothetical protein PF003_g35702 [Phytophthora fragariae]